MVRQNFPDPPPAALTSWAYERLLQRAHDLAEKSLQSLEGLHDLDPSAVASEAIEAIRRSHDRLAEAGPGRDERDRRRAPRFPALGSKLILATPGETGPGWEVPALNRCWNGFAVLSDRPLAVGAVVTVWEAQPLGATPPVRAEVKFCRPQGDVWVVGCELLPAAEQRRPA
jgi:hypothetical protein